ncbi:MAG: DUF2752 domain-containing protein [Ignavibacteria bacterium]
MFSDNKYFSIIQNTPKQSRKTIYVMLLLLVLSLVNVYFAPLKVFLNDVAGIESVNGCPLLTFTGIPCPFCGTGRVFSTITDIPKRSHYIAMSFYYNPLGLPFFIIFGFFYFTFITLAFMRRKVFLKKPAYRLWYIPVIFFLLMWVLNILYGHHH